VITYRWTSPGSPMYSPPPSRWRQAAHALGARAARLLVLLVLLVAFEVAMVFQAGGWA
jgi:hypothetical protein